MSIINEKIDTKQSLVRLLDVLKQLHNEETDLFCEIPLGENEINSPLNRNYFGRRVAKWDLAEDILKKNIKKFDLTYGDFHFSESNFQIFEWNNTFDNEIDSSTKSSTSNEEKSKIRNSEMNWIKNNPEKISELMGHWISLDGSTLVCYDKDFIKVYKTSIERGIKKPFIHYISENTKPVVG
jgi:hypothetical protein